MRSNKLAVVVAVCIVIAVVAVIEARVLPFSSGSRYYDEDEGFSVVVPEDWEIGTKMAWRPLTVTSPLESDDDDFREGFDIEVRETETTTLEEVFHDMVEWLSSRSDFVEYERGQARLSSAESRWLIFGYKEDVYVEQDGVFKWEKRRTRKDMVYYLLREGRWYQITFRATDDSFSGFRDKFTEIAGSFRFE